MKGLVRTVGEMLDDGCLVDGRLNKQGCRISMTGAPGPRLIVDFDRPGSPLGPDRTRCDYLFVAEDDKGDDWIAPLELKRGRLQANEVVRQLQAGARVAEQLVSSNDLVRFRPVAASGSTPKAERDKLKNKDNRVLFHGRAETVRLISCGAPLAGALGA